jgi:DNA mismatch endonuclease (patch repair protein)
MIDVVDVKTRSRMMSGIKSKNTKPELMLRHALHSRGFRYRLHSNRIPGHPDLILPKFRAIVFVHGCFWHQHDDCRYATIPSTRTSFWKEKFRNNKARDIVVQRTAHQQGWRIGIVWECTLRDNCKLTLVVDILEKWLCSDRERLEISAI